MEEAKNERALSLNSKFTANYGEGGKKGGGRRQSFLSAVRISEGKQIMKRRTRELPRT